MLPRRTLACTAVALVFFVVFARLAAYAEEGTPPALAPSKPHLVEDERLYRAPVTSHNLTEAQAERVSEFMSRERPYNLTFVMASRNDAYALRSRMRALRVMNHFAHEYKVSVELIIVVWNPDPKEPPLADTLWVPPHLASVRVILVPRALHKQWVPEGLVMPPVMEFLAKNIGIRRARGQWIMGHAIDTMITEAFWQWMSSDGPVVAEKERGVPLLFRMSRLDCDEDVKREEPKAGVSPKDELQEVLRRPRRLLGLQRLDVSRWSERKVRAAMKCARAMVNDLDELFTDASGDFELMSPASWMRVRAYMEVPTYGHFDTVLLYHARRNGLRFHLVDYPALVVHENHGDGGFEKRITAFHETPYWEYEDKDNPNTDDWGHAQLLFQEAEWHYGRLVYEGVPGRRRNSKKKN